MSDETYNGWTNRETWAVALHIDNTEGWHNYRNVLCQQARDDAIATEYLSFEQVAQRRLSTSLERWVTCQFEEVFHNPGMATKDMRMMAAEVGSLWRVNWDEIARNWLDDFEAAA